MKIVEIDDEELKAILDQFNAQELFIIKKFNDMLEKKIEDSFYLN